MLTKLTSMNMESILESKESVRSPTVSGATFQLNLDKLTPGQSGVQSSLNISPEQIVLNEEEQS